MCDDYAIRNKYTKNGIRVHWTNSFPVAIKCPRKLTENLPILLKWKEKKLSSDCSPISMELTGHWTSGRVPQSGSAKSQCKDDDNTDPTSTVASKDYVIFCNLLFETVVVVKSYQYSCLPMISLTWTLLSLSFLYHLEYTVHTSDTLWEIGGWYRTRYGTNHIEAILSFNYITKFASFWH